MMFHDYHASAEDIFFRKVSCDSGMPMPGENVTFDVNLGAWKWIKTVRL